MRNRISLVVTISAFSQSSGWRRGVASAHNSGHLIRPYCSGGAPDGSQRDAPFVGAGNPNQSPGFNPAGQST